MARDIKSDLIAFLREHFDDSGIDVSFDVGNPEDPSEAGDVRFSDPDGPKEYPQVAIVSEDSTVPGGGQTQYSGIDAGGRGGIQDIVTSVQIDCWGGPPDDEIYQDSDSDPDSVANELGWQTHDVLFEADDSEYGPPVPDGYEWVNAEPPFENNDIEATPTHYRRTLVARLKHTKRP